MGEIAMGCTYGTRYKQGKRKRGPSCFNRAHGLWKVTFFRGWKIMPLCAECGFNRMPNHVTMVLGKNDEPPKFYHDVLKIELLVSFSTNFDQSKMTPTNGVKHWVDAKPKSEPIPSISTYTKIKSKKVTKLLDMSAYDNSLSRHDDGK